MEITTILFVYKRYQHTKIVLEALSKNTKLPQKLLVFQDGIKDNKDKKEWKLVNELINKQSFCPIEIIVSDYNKGLAKSITDGVSYALKKSDAIIVLEDDCVPSSNFMMYMEKTLHFYENNKKVWGISGYGWPGVKSDKSDYDVYFGGRISSWGWATWNDRWDKYSKDVDIVRRIRLDKESSVYLSKWGNDLEVMMKDQVLGKNDSWAVYWALNMIEERGVYVMPYVSQIKNIGLDGSGEHCSTEIFERYNVDIDQDVIIDFRLPKKVLIEDNIEEMVKPLFGSFLVKQKKALNKKNVIVYGIGGCFLSHEKELVEKYNIEYLFDMYKSGYVAGIKILTLEELKIVAQRTDIYITIMLYNNKEYKKVRDFLMQYCGISYQKFLCYGEDYDN